MTLLESVLKFLTAGILLSSGITISLALFRVPLRNNIMKIISIGVVMELISIAFEFIKDHEVINFSIIVMVIAEILLISFLFKLPYLYSILICIFGFLGAGPVLIGITLLVTKLGISSNEVIHSNTLHLYLFRLICSTILLSGAFFIYSKKIGFILKANQFQLKNVSKKFYIGLFFILWIASFIIMLTKYNPDYFSLLFTAYCIVFIIGLVAAYKLNKKHIREKYDDRKL